MVKSAGAGLRALGRSIDQRQRRWELSSNVELQNLNPNWKPDIEKLVLPAVWNTGSSVAWMTSYWGQTCVNFFNYEFQQKQKALLFFTSCRRLFVAVTNNRAGAPANDSLSLFKRAALVKSASKWAKRHAFPPEPISVTRLEQDNSKLGSTQQQKICWHWHVARIIQGVSKKR